MGLEHPAQLMGQELELLGPVQGGVEVELDLGKHAIEQQVLKLLFVADMVVDRAPGRPQDGRPGRAWSRPGRRPRR
jgi:hypothetical protein